MGCYSRLSLVQDSCRHGVEVRPVDVCISNWDARLEPISQGSQPAVRLALNNIKGLEQEAAWRIEEARAIRPFENTPDLAERANQNAGHLNALASANALESLSGNRRHALWDAVASAPDKGLLRSATVIEEPVEMEAPGEAENIVADYRHLGLTLGRHPLALLRPRLAAMKFLPADILNQFDNGRLARGCGIVTVRQRPQTAKGVIFVTIEDESGTVNVICWPKLVEQQHRELMGAQLLGVYGVWQCERNVRLGCKTVRAPEQSAWGTGHQVADFSLRSYRPCSLRRRLSAVTATNGRCEISCVFQMSKMLCSRLLAKIDQKSSPVER